MKSIILLAALAVSHTAIAANSLALVGPEDCRVVKLDPKSNATVTWSGGCKDGYADGEGTLVWLASGKEKSRYEGTLKQGRPHGQGYSVSSQGVQYEGSFVEGRRDGRGIVMAKDGTRYEGDFKAGKFHGTGSIVYRNKARYDGQFEAGRFHGKGKAVYIGGQVFEGEFKQGVAVDQASRVKPEDAVYHLRPEPTAAASNRTAYAHSGRPMDKSYSQMTKSQQQGIRDEYPLLHDTDEPPYLTRGPQSSVDRITRFHSAEDLPGGLLDIRAQIDANGNATAFYVISSPDPKLSNFVASMLMKEKFKPGVCAGQPCTMEFHYSMNFNY
jgi:hypothetical protein